MGDIQSEEGRDIVLELCLPALPGPVEGDPVVKAELSYFNVVTSRMDTVDCQLKVNRAGIQWIVLRVGATSSPCICLCTDGERGAGNMNVDIQRNRIFTTAVLKQAETLADQGIISISYCQTGLTKCISIQVNWQRHRQHSTV
jgi:hypothetical protein